MEGRNKMNFTIERSANHWGMVTKDGYAYHREFERCCVDVNLETKTSSIVWKLVAKKNIPSKEKS